MVSFTKLGIAWEEALKHVEKASIYGNDFGKFDMM